MRNNKGQFIKGECSGEKHPRWKGGRLAWSRKHNCGEYYKKARSAALESLGGRCIKCGFDDKRALQIDHILGDGFKERQSINQNRLKFYKLVMESFLKQENKYQLLCANCNWIKKVENNEIKKK